MGRELAWQKKQSKENEKKMEKNLPPLPSLNADSLTNLVVIRYIQIQQPSFFFRMDFIDSSRKWT